MIFGNGGHLAVVLTQIVMHMHAMNDPFGILDQPFHAGATTNRPDHFQTVERVAFQRFFRMLIGLRTVIGGTVYLLPIGNAQSERIAHVRVVVFVGVVERLKSLEHG